MCASALKSAAKCSRFTSHLMPPWLPPIAAARDWTPASTRPANWWRTQCSRSASSPRLRRPRATRNRRRPRRRPSRRHPPRPRASPRRRRHPRQRQARRLSRRHRRSLHRARRSQRRPRRPSRRRRPRRARHRRPNLPRHLRRRRARHRQRQARHPSRRRRPPPHLRLRLRRRRRHRPRRPSSPRAGGSAASTRPWSYGGAGGKARGGRRRCRSRPGEALGALEDGGLPMRVLVIAAALAALGGSAMAQSSAPEDLDRLKRMLDERLPSAPRTRGLSKGERPLRSDDFYSIRRREQDGPGNPSPNPGKRSGYEAPGLLGIGAAMAGEGDRDRARDPAVGAAPRGSQRVQARRDSYLIVLKTDLSGQQLDDALATLSQKYNLEITRANRLGEIRVSPRQPATRSLAPSPSSESLGAGLEPKITKDLRN